MKKKFNANKSIVYLTYSRKKTWHHYARSITNGSTILETFLILIMCMLSTAMAQSSTANKIIDCKPLATSSLSYQLYDFERYNVSQLKYNSFIQKCKSHPSDEDVLNDFIFSYRNQLSPMGVTYNNDFNLFIFDFRVIKNDFVYVVSKTTYNGGKKSDHHACFIPLSIFTIKQVQLC